MLFSSRFDVLTSPLPEPFAGTVARIDRRQMSQPIAILTAMEQEGRLVEASLDAHRQESWGGRRYVSGTVAQIPIVTAISGFGKVAAAATVAAVLERYRPAKVLFAGVAGGVGRGVAIGDIVVAESLVQHDFDARPLFDRFVVPSLGSARITADPALTDGLVTAAAEFLAKGGLDPAASSSGTYDPASVTVHRGTIASGDRFIASIADASVLLRDLPDVLAVEMEGAAVAQVCTEAGVPFAVFRSISDRADHLADADFLAFIESVAAPLTAGIVTEFLLALS